MNQAQPIGVPVGRVASIWLGQSTSVNLTFVADPVGISVELTYSADRLPNEEFQRRRPWIEIGRVQGDHDAIDSPSLGNQTHSFRMSYEGEVRHSLPRPRPRGLGFDIGFNLILFV